MNNIKRFYQYLNESISNNNLLYSAITALAIVNPTFFDFLNDNKQRYFYHDRSFWQAFILELKIQRNIKLKKEHLLNIKGISIENDWAKLKKCVNVAEKIKNKFFNIKEIWINENNEMIVVTNNSKNIFRDKKSDDKIVQSDLEDVLGFSTRNIYSNEKWDKLILKFINLLKNELKPTFLKALEYFTDQIFEKQLNINWEIYKNFKVDGLGIKLDMLPKLYYNKLYDYCIDVTENKNAFRDYNFFIDKWYDIKNTILNKDIIFNLYNQNKKNRIDSITNIIQKEFSLGNKKYYHFDSNLNITELPPKQSLNIENGMKIHEKFWINEKKSLILELYKDSFSLKILIGLKNIAPSKIIIKEKYEEKGDKKFDI